MFVGTGIQFILWSIFGWVMFCIVSKAFSDEFDPVGNAHDLLILYGVWFAVSHIFNWGW